MSLSDQTRVTLQVGQIIAIVVAIIGGASWATGIDAKAELAKTETQNLKSEVASMRAELIRQRELIATIQGDTRAILQLTRLRNDK